MGLINTLEESLRKDLKPWKSKISFLQDDLMQHNNETLRQALTEAIAVLEDIETWVKKTKQWPNDEMHKRLKSIYNKLTTILT